MRVVVGLGNPGTAYVETLHNVGFVVLEELARRWNTPWSRPTPGVRVASACMNEQAVILVEPQLYMNRSGAALAEFDASLSPQILIVVHDDLDLECGRLRVKRAGGTAGHRGLDSIVARFGNDFTRVRIGIGRPARGLEPAEFVLSPVSPADRATIETATRHAADAVECILQHGEQVAMNQFNRRPTSGSTQTVPSGRE